MYRKYYILFIIIIICSIIIQSIKNIEKFVLDNDMMVISDNYANFKSILYDKKNKFNDKQQYKYEYNVVYINPDNIEPEINNNTFNVDVYEDDTLSVAKYEGFSNNNLTKISDLIFDIILNQIKENYSVPNKLLNNTDKKKLKIFIDPYVNYYLLGNENRDNFNYHNKMGFFVRISPFKLGPNDCSWNLLNKTIAYTCMTDFYFIMGIIKGHRLDQNKIKLVKINSLELTNYAEVFHKKEIDILITYVIEESLYTSILQDINYNVTGFRDMDINRIKAFYPFPKENYMRLTNLFTNKISALSINNESDMLVPSMFMTYLDDIDITNSYVDVVEKFITRLKMPDDAYDPTYLCYGDSSTENKAQCNSPIDVDGLTKRRYTIWDKVCLKNEECPYYKGNNTYNNERGRCKEDGICEMPVGVQRLGFTKHSDKGYFKPFCYGCDEYDEDCCNSQSNPDYVYPNDFDEREKSGKSTIVSNIKYVY